MSFPILEAAILGLGLWTWGASLANALDVFHGFSGGMLDSMMHSDGVHEIPPMSYTALRAWEYPAWSGVKGCGAESEEAILSR